MNSIFVTIVKYIIDIPKCQTVELNGALKYVTSSSVSSSSEILFGYF